VHYDFELQMHHFHERSLQIEQIFHHLQSHRLMLA